MKETTATLINGNYFTFKEDSVTCPCCINGAMILKSKDDESITFECVACKATLNVPCVSLKEEHHNEF